MDPNSTNNNSNPGNNNPFANPPSTPTLPDISQPPLSSPPLDPLSPTPTAPQPENNSWPQPITPLPVQDTNLSANPWLSPIPIVPTPPPTTPTSDSTPTPAFSPIDNPVNTPSQTPIDSSQQNWSFSPPSSGMDQTPLSVDPIAPPQQNMPVSPAIEAPTDLSHLIGNGSPAVSDTQPTSAETMILPQNNGGNPEVPNIPAVKTKGIPSWMIGLGVALFLLVAGASAYFILGVGKTPENISLPAQISDTENAIKPPAPVPTPPQAQPSPQEATGSSSFGQLQGSTPNQTSQASSAAEILKSRQQQTR